MSTEMTPRRIIDLLKRMRTDIDLIRRQLTSVTVRLPGRLSPQGQQTPDWDLVITPGFYWSTGSANGPATGLIVGTVEVGDGSVIQRVATSDAARVWSRRSADNGVTWSAWALEMGRHLTDNAGNGRAYVGTGQTATGNGETYIGMSPINGLDDGNAAAVWFAWPTTPGGAPGTQVRLMKSGNIDAPAAAYAEARGSATTAPGGSVTITFPSGRFSVAPNITIGPITIGVFISCSAKSATSATFAARDRAGAVLAASFDWSAAQMTAGSASG